MTIQEGNMIMVRLASDRRNHFGEAEEIVNNEGPVYLTKNIYGSMLARSVEVYSRLTDDVEPKLDEADRSAELDMIRLSHGEVFGKIRVQLLHGETI